MAENEKTVLVIAYYYPPCNLTPSQKAYSWAKYFGDCDLKPIVITRNWDINISNSIDVLRPIGENVKIEKSESGEVHYLPNRLTLHSKLYFKKDILSKFLYKGLTLIKRIIQNFNNNFVQHKFLYDYSREFLLTHKVDAILITGSPFILFKFGYLLSKEFGIPWAADYRDMWSTQKLHDSSRNNVLFKLIDHLEAKSEKKWVSTASFISSVSKHYANCISNFTKVRGEEIPNGFFEEDLEELDGSQFDKFTICYSGTLFDKQVIETFLLAFKAFIKKSKSDNIELVFLGAAWKPVQQKRILKYCEGLEPFVRITPRLERKAALQFQKSCHVLLLFPYKETEDVIPSKIYEYFGLGRDILLCPGDNQIVHALIEGWPLGTVLSGVEETRDFLYNKYEEFIKGRLKDISVSKDKVFPYTRRSSAYKMAKLIHDI